MSTPTITELESELLAAQQENERLRRDAAVMREAFYGLFELAAEFVGPGEDGVPVCNCCHMELESVNKGHRTNCLANAVLGSELSMALKPGAGRDYVSREEVRSIVEALEWCERHLFIMAEPPKRISDALTRARELGLLEEGR